MGRKTYAIRLDEDIHDYIKSKGDISKMLEDALKNSACYPSVENVFAEIKSNRAEYERLKILLKKRIDIEVQEKFDDEVRTRHIAYKQTTKYPISYKEFYDKHKKQNSEAIAKKIKEEIEKYEQV